MAETTTHILTGQSDELHKPQPGDYQVWYIPQIPMPAFRATLPRNTGVWEKLTDLEVAEIAAEIANLLGEFSLYEYENRVKPDYTDAGGVARIQSVVGDKVDTIDVDWDAEVQYAAEVAA